MCVGLCDGIGWIRSHFYFLAQRWWRLSRAEPRGDVASGLSSRQAQFQSHIYCIHWFITSHTVLYNPRLRKRRGAGGGKEEVLEARVRGKQPLGLFVPALWNEEGGDNTLKALRKYWISAVRAPCQVECFLIISFSDSFPLSLSVFIYQFHGEMCRSGARKEIKRLLCHCMRIHVQNYQFHDPPSCPPPVHYLLPAPSVSLSQSFHRSPPHLLSPKIQSCMCWWWRGARQFYASHSRIY